MQAESNAGLGQRVKDAREGQRLTQNGLAKLLGISRTAVTQWEAGLTFPSFDKTVEMGKLLKVRPEWIAFGVREAGDQKHLEDVETLEVLTFGPTAEDRTTVGHHALSQDFIRESLRCAVPASLFVWELETQGFPRQIAGRDHLIVERTIKISEDGFYLIWNGYVAQLVMIQSNLAQLGSVTVIAGEESSFPMSVEADKLVILGKIRGKIGVVP